MSRPVNSLRVIWNRYAHYAYAAVFTCTICNVYAYYHDVAAAAEGVVASSVQRAVIDVC
jgi:hypothetical protein